MKDVDSNEGFLIFKKGGKWIYWREMERDRDNIIWN
jgi:hypothetical protein